MRDKDCDFESVCKPPIVYLSGVYQSKVSTSHGSRDFSKKSCEGSTEK